MARQIMAVWGGILSRFLGCLGPLAQAERPHAVREKICQLTIYGKTNHFENIAAVDFLRFVAR